MMKTVKGAIQLLVASVALLGLLACQKQEVAQGEKGPAEKAGQQIDQAAARASEELNKAAEKAGEGLQALGQKIQNTAEKSQADKKSE